VTAKEKLLERAPHWSEEEAKRALRAAEGDETVDEWGDLSKLHELTAAKMMRRLADKEHAARHKALVSADPFAGHSILTGCVGPPWS
jgi:hypothetical protein